MPRTAADTTSWILQSTIQPRSNPELPSLCVSPTSEPPEQPLFSRHTKPLTPPPAAAVAATTASGGGCMNVVLHIFYFQRFHICLHPQLDHNDYPPPPLQPLTSIPTFSLDHHHHHAASHLKEKHQGTAWSPRRCSHAETP